MNKRPLNTAISPQHRKMLDEMVKDGRKINSIIEQSIELRYEQWKQIQQAIQMMKVQAL